MGAANSEDAAIGFELAAIHAPNLIIQVDKFASNANKKSKRFNKTVFDNYRFLALSQNENLHIGHSIPCDSWEIEVKKFTNDRFSIKIVRGNEKIAFVSIISNHAERLKNQLKNKGWQ